MLDLGANYDYDVFGGRISSLFRCTVCKRTYKAQYSGQFPVCKHCQWEIYNGKEYWYCNDCGEAKLVYPGLSGSYCCSGDTFQVRNILNRVNVASLIKWANSNGYRRSDIVERYAIQVGNFQQGVGNDGLICNCYGDKGEPFRFDKLEDAQWVVNNLADAVIIKVKVPETMKVFNVNDFYICPHCSKITVLSRGSYVYVGGRSEYVVSIPKYVCASCKKECTHCVVCHTLVKQDASKIRTCSNKCLDEHIIREMKAKEEREARELKFKAQEEERKLNAYLENKRKIDSDFDAESSYVLHALGEENLFISANTNAIVLSGLTDALHLDSEEEAIAARDLVNKSNLARVGVMKSWYTSGYEEYRLSVCPKCCKPVVFSKFDIDVDCSYCETKLRICKICKELWSLDDKHRQWFLDKNLAVPVRCEDCRSSKIRA